jgi:adenylosuccinate synthase
VGVTKAYTTRVGAGPFPTEDTGPAGLHLRDVGAEYGTTTGRERRCGWYDAVVNRYAVRLNTLTELMVNKFDVLTGLDPVRLCIAYEVDGERTEEMPWHQTDFHHAVPVYEDWPGWTEDLTECREWGGLPKASRAVLDRIEELADVPVTAVGVGPARHHVVDRP